MTTVVLLCTHLGAWLVMEVGAQHMHERALGSRLVAFVPYVWQLSLVSYLAWLVAMAVLGLIKWRQQAQVGGHESVRRVDLGP